MEIGNIGSSHLRRFVLIPNPQVVQQFKQRFDQASKGRFVLKKVKEHNMNLILDKVKFKEHWGDMQSNNSAFLVNMYTNGEVRCQVSPLSQFKRTPLSVERKQPNLFSPHRELSINWIVQKDEHFKPHENRSTLEQKLIRYRLNHRDPNDNITNDKPLKKKSTNDVLINVMSHFHQNMTQMNTILQPTNNIQVEQAKIRIRKTSKKVKRRALSPGIKPIRTLITTTSFCDPKRIHHRNVERIRNLEELISDKELAEYSQKIQHEYHKAR